MAMYFAITCCFVSRVVATLWPCLVAAAVGGCVAFPVPVTPVLDIPREQRETLKVGETKRADILMRYGKPELRLEADRVLVYRWDRERGHVLIILAPDLPIRVRDSEALLLAFDARGTLLRIGTTVAWRDDTIEQEAKEWARGITAPDRRMGR